MKRTVTTALNWARAQEPPEQLASRNLSEICATTLGCIAPRYSKPGARRAGISARLGVSAREPSGNLGHGRTQGALATRGQ